MLKTRAHVLFCFLLCFVLFFNTALEARKVSHTLNGAGLVEDGLRLCKDLSSSTSCKVEQPGAGCNRQSAHFEVHEEQSDVHSAESCNETSGTESDHEKEESPQESPAEEHEVPQSERFENNGIKKTLGLNFI